MRAASVSNPEHMTSETLVAIEIDLKAEAAAIEKLRKQLSDAGAGASKDLMADYAKRQKAFLDRKIVFEKQKRTFSEEPQPTPKAPENKTTPAPQKTAPKTPAPVKPAAKVPEVSKSKAPVEKAPETKRQEVKKPEIKKPEEKKIALKPAEPAARQTTVKSKPTPQPRRQVSLLDDDEEESSTDEGSGLSPLAWVIIAAAISVAIWYFARR